MEGKNRLPFRFDNRRVFSALVFIPLFYLYVQYLPASAFFLLITGVALLALREFHQVCFGDRHPGLLMITGFIALGGLLATMQWAAFSPLALILQILVMAGLLSFMFLPSAFTLFSSPPRMLVFGIAYIGVGLGHLLLIRNLEDGQLLIFFLLLITWAADTGAYYVGKTIGRHQIAPRLSPKKTVEGIGGGLLLAMAITVITHFILLPTLSMKDCFILAVLLTFIGFVGDLAESSFKRHGKVKDSGTLIPGHGGILDRIDSLLLTSPAFYYYVILIKSPTGL